MSALMVFVNDPLSDFIRKGETPARYYNPGGLFDEIHIWMINEDRPDADLLQRMAGNAKLILHNLPISKKIFIKSLAWRPYLLREWAGPAIESAAKIRPKLIRCHGNLLNAVPAMFIKESLGIPYVVSLHNYPDAKACLENLGWKARLLLKSTQAVERSVLMKADRVLPVYKSILPYLDRLGVSNYEIAYNVIPPDHLRKKEDYRLAKPVKVISVGRQLHGKNPDNIIKAIRMLPEVELLIVGDGPLHESLRKTAEAEGVSARVEFRKSVPNDRLCGMLREFDICATHSDYGEISKAVLEALLTGLPVVINRREGDPVPEFVDGPLLMVENSPEAYRMAIRKLIDDDDFREGLGRKAFAHSQAHWSPVKAEENFVRIYSDLMGSGRVMGLEVSERTETGMGTDPNPQEELRKVEK
jgi:glycosyltransferase involved in cell wall biosynthesis